MSGPVNIPGWDELLANPTLGYSLPFDAARKLLPEAAALVAVLNIAAQSDRETSKTDSPTAPERWITAKEASALYGPKPRWFRDNKDKLPHSKPSHKVLLFPEQKLQKWFAAHKAH